MAYTQSDLTAIDTAIATGELEVTVDGKSVRYRSIPELMAARAFIAGQIAQTTGRRRAVFYFTPSMRRD